MICQQNMSINGIQITNKIYCICHQMYEPSARFIFFLFCDLIGQSFVPEKISLNAFVLISDFSNKITRKNTEREKKHETQFSFKFRVYT